MLSAEKIIEQTQQWIFDVVIGCNFCLFAAKVVKQQSIHYIVENGITKKEGLQTFIRECTRLDEAKQIDTTIIIFPHAFEKFEDYLDLVDLAESLLKKEGYEGIYQVASFHPKYRFAGTGENDAANYTNRSVYPMLHLLREESIEKALEKYPDAAGIPERNINFAREKGLVYMKMLRDGCLGE